jgi:hypothetical protein
MIPLSPTSTLTGRRETSEKVLSRPSVVGFFYLIIGICILLLMGRKAGYGAW